ncbi:hypothetical protein ACQ9SL_004369 [Escherichia coli]|nr:hypothetical protein [Escherichia coli]HBA8566577.1 hypothetical protein [Escherichia coli]HBA9037262.1 hypothetical protein [Escherichia coli]HBA9681704.1 hypothetical protein [Escherichia coli]HBB8661439.1 hypothetical protein [Escherichia coli]
MIEVIIPTLSLILLLKYAMKKRLIIIVIYLIIFDIVFFISIFGEGSWEVARLSYMLAPFSLSIIINMQVILAIIFRKKGAGYVLLSSFAPPVFFSFWDYGFIIPSHPLMVFYQFDVLYKILPRFNRNIINVIILYIFPFFFLLPIRKFMSLMIILLPFFFIKWNIIEREKLGIKVLVVQTGMFLSKHDNVVELRNEIFKYNNADIVIFSESPDIGFKSGSRITFTHNLLNEIKEKNDNKLYILNNYGFVDDEKHKYNYNLSLYVMNGSMRIKAKNKLVPFWEVPGFFYSKSDWESKFFSVPSKKMMGQYKFRNININSYICYEAMFAKHASDTNDLTIIQSNYGTFKKGYDRIVKNGNLIAYVNKSSGFNSFISVQNMGGTIFVDNTGKFHWDIYNKSLKQAVFLFEI